MSDERRVWIKLISQRSGGRYDNRDWPAPGVPFDVPEWEGEALTRIKEAIYTSDEEAANISQPNVDTNIEPLEREYHGGEPVSAPNVDAEVEPIEVTAEPEAAPEAEETAPVDDVAGEEPAADEEVKKPAPYASKADWVNYAVAQGHDSDDASSLTKSELQSRYGGRL